jgi:hypothetical protein
MLRRSARRLAPLSLALLALAAPASAKTFVYVHDAGKQVFGFAVSGGELVPVEGSPFLGPDLPFLPEERCDGHCRTMAYLRKAALLLTTGPGGITPWRVGKDGALAPVPLAPFALGPGLYHGVAGLEIAGAGYAYLADLGIDVLHGFRVEEDDTLGYLDGFPVATGGAPLVVAAGKRTVSVLNSLDSSVSSFRAEADGSLTPAPTSPFDFAGVAAFTLDADTAGKNVYSGEQGADAAFAFELDAKSGALEPHAGNPLPTGLANTGLGFEARGKLVLAFSLPGEVRALRRGKDGLVALGEPTDLGFVPFAHALSRNGRLLAVANDSELRAFRVSASGALEPAGNASISASNANAVAIVSR